MASLAKFHYTDQTVNLRFNGHRRFQPRPVSYRIFEKKLHFPSLAIRASSSSSSSSSNSSLLKSACVTLTAAAALFSASLHLIVKPAAATPIAPPPSTTTNLAVEETTERDEISLQEEEVALEKRLASQPNDVEALKSLMKIKFKTKNLEQAIEILDRLIKLDPKEQEWPILKAQAQTYGGDFDSATKGFEEILIKDPFRVEAYHGLLMAYSNSESKLTDVERRISEAMERCKKENKKKDYRDFMLLIAQIKVIEGNPVEALRVYEEMVKDEPRDFRPYLCQGLIYTLMKKKEEAEKQFEQFRRLVPENHPYKEYFDSNVLNTKKLFAKNIIN